MADAEKLVASVIVAAGGEIVGRIRLQKEFYLLDQMGLNSGFSYSYHHYGPYSADLADAVDGAKAFRYVEEQTRHRRSDGVPFSVFSIHSGFSKENDEDLPLDKLDRAIRDMQEHSATVLELAATIHWLKAVEHVEDWNKELVRRKGAKTEGGRTEMASKLLADLGIEA